MAGTQKSYYMKYVKKILLALVVCAVGVWVWKMTFTTNVSYDNLTRITRIKEMIRLNTFEMVNEFVYKDTLDDIGVVYNIKSRITIGFDLDSLSYREVDGVLEVELPPANVIDIHSLDCRLLDCYNTGFTGDLFGAPDVSPQQWSRIRRDMEKYIKQEIVRKGYVERARKNAIENLAQLFHALKGDVRIIDGQPQKTDIEWGKMDFRQVQRKLPE